MIYRYFRGAMPRARTIRRIELLTDGAVTAQDFYNDPMEHRNGGEKPPKEYGLSAPAQQASPSNVDGMEAGNAVSAAAALDVREHSNLNQARVSQ
jgi:hypothetical protein